jgi:hypothetical protein
LLVPGGIVVMGLIALNGAESVSCLTALMPFQLLNAPTLAPVESAEVTSGLAKKSPLLPLCEPPGADGAGLGRAEVDVLILAGIAAFCFCGL